ncbi:DUF3742 family protein [Streptomyces sp. TRM75563]|uniref:DUF3742 family protein n=1 Tax=Streptomyces sp. TRM75563 TaxID=2817418 RepID=UPI001F6180FE|nr:DUF3742 family protein [Streptomyces sp. TRM75563]MCI4045116.1 DUF3742 family protein [Streptomyces sp. TRM75563]
MTKTTAMQRRARTLTHGQRLLLRRITARAAAWVHAGRRADLDGIAAILGCVLRLAVLAAGAYGAWLLIRRWPAVLWVAVPVWCWAAIRAIPTETAEQPANEEGGSEPAPAAEQPSALPTLQDVRDAVSKVGTPHAHLAVLAEALGTTTDRVREVLAEHDIPVEPVRMRGRGSSTGVKADHFPAPAAPSGDVVAAGQPANNNTNNVTVQHNAGGAHITVTPARQEATR